MRNEPKVEDLAARLYLRLLRRCLCRDLFPDARYEETAGSLTKAPFEPGLRAAGKDWPTEAETMVGMKRLENVEDCCIRAIRNGVPGDFVETGVWRGGCGILMRAVLAATGEHSRRIWLFDSFQGLPKPDPASFPDDTDDRHWTFSGYLGVNREMVAANFDRYELLDARVEFMQGWFRDTVPNAAVDRIAVLRLDGDMYESTWLVLTHLYPKLSTGGYVIIDDYGAIASCRKAVEDFRSKYNIRAPLQEIDWTGVFWHK